MEIFENIYNGKRVFVTGDTGFKGTWLTKWLIDLGADVTGYSLNPNTNPSHYYLLNNNYKTYFSDIRNIKSLEKAIIESKPDIIFHLAAQPLVRYSYLNPVETYETNVMGTVNILEIARKYLDIKAVVVVTSDKCYENLEHHLGYIETDRMGGYDPYSSSKGCVELLTNSFRNSYFNLNKYNINHSTLLATVRAGNVIGGGDWSSDRLIPDLMRDIVKGEPTLIRSPNSTRPWQHVLEPIHGYLKVGYKLLQGNVQLANSWNFGPEENQALRVIDILNYAKKYWNQIEFNIENINEGFHEANLLSLNIDKAKLLLEWRPVWTNEIAIQKTINWYKNFYQNKVINTNDDIHDFINSIKSQQFEI